MQFPLKSQVLQGGKHGNATQLLLTKLNPFAQVMQVFVELHAMQLLIVQRLHSETKVYPATQYSQFRLDWQDWQPWSGQRTHVPVVDIE